MKSAFFISDVHLNDKASHAREALLHLLKRAQKEAELFVVVGDLFDLWVGRSPILQKKYFDVISEFAKLKKTCRLIYLEGNHDFHLKYFWNSNVGFEVYEGPANITFNNFKLRLEHGDESDLKDLGYIFLRKVLRTYPIKKLADLIPSSLVVKIGEKGSHASRKYTDFLKDSKRVENILQGTRLHAAKVAAQNDFDLLITGHTHVADDYAFEVASKTRRLINLGSWFEGPHFLEIDSSGQVSHHQIKI